MQSTPPVGAHDQQLRTLGLRDEVPHRTIWHDHSYRYQANACSALTAVSVRATCEESRDAWALRIAYIYDC
ncbi:hypothetical protein MHPYR_10178 [uncultured Mycobacterium sp.]|uniref:Uncharacterized protein n=1 Tax=uncultured Mycobacterium sp. TaxID=171292 RepID=A0A1Y5P3I2_9MYCO|nr:hypothetical protein MHPYR_10178 [uncultured Mycobacterium sp.]